MGVETATFISQLSATNPLASDAISQGDDQIRLVKSVLQSQFTTLGAAAVTTTAGEINVLDAVTAGTAAASKAVVLDSNAAVNAVKTAALHIGASGSETAVTATGAELNYNDITTLGTVEASKVVTATAGGVVNHADLVVQRPQMKDYSETVAAAGSKTSAFNLDLESGNVQSLTMSGGGTFNIGITNALTSHSNSLTIIGTNLGSVTATFYAGAHDGGGNKVYWADGDQATNAFLTASGTDVITFTTFDGGTNWYGFVAGVAMTNS